MKYRYTRINIWDMIHLHLDLSTPVLAQFNEWLFLKKESKKEWKPEIHTKEMMDKAKIDCPCNKCKEKKGINTPELREEIEQWKERYKRGLNALEVRKNIEQMKKLDSERELVEIEKLNLDYYTYQFDNDGVSNRTFEVELAVENKINELVDRVSELSKKK